MRVRFFSLVVLSLMAFALPPQKTTVWLIGDSTMSIKEVKAYPAISLVEEAKTKTVKAR